MKNILLFLLYVSLIFECSSQDFSIRGKIKSADKKEKIVSANVILTRLTDLKKYGDFSDKEGCFIINKLRSGRYSLRISFIGYGSFQKELEIKSQNIDLDLILLEPDSIILKEVTAEGKAILVQQIDDTTQYDPKAVRLHEDALTEELLKKLPGIKIDKNGRIQSQGETITKVYIDKKPFFGNDPNVALKNIPAAMIDRVQVYDEESEQSEFTGFSDGKTVKVINLDTKFDKKLKEAKFGKLSGSYGSEERYQAGGNINLFDSLNRISLVGMTNNMNVSNFSSNSDKFVQMRSTQRNQDHYIHGFGVSYADSKKSGNELSCSYYFTTADGKTESMINRQYTVSILNKNYIESRNSETGENTHKFDLKYSHDFNGQGSIMIIPKFVYQSNKSSAIFNGKTEIDKTILNEIQNNSVAKSDDYNIFGKVIYNQKLTNYGRSFSIQFDGSIDKTEEDDEWTNITKQYSDNGDIVFQNILHANNSRERLSTNILFTEPINQQNIFQFSYNIDYVYDDYDKLNYEMFIGSLLIDSLASSGYRNNNWNHKSGISYNYNLKDIKFSAGIFYNINSYGKNQEFPFLLEVDRVFKDISANLMFSYKVGKSSRMKLSYSLHPVIPSLEKMQSILYNKNPLQLSIGNSNLKEAMNHSISINIPKGWTEFLGDFNLNFSGNWIQNYIGNSTIFAANDTIVLNNILLQKGAIITYPDNFSRQLRGNFGISYFYKLDFMNSLFNFDLSYKYSEIPNSFNGISQNSIGHSIGFVLQLLQNTSDNFDAEIILDYSHNYRSNRTGSLQKIIYNEYGTELSLRYILPFNLSFLLNCQHQYNTSITSGSKNNILANISISQKFLRAKSAEVKFSIYDILNQNKDISRSVTDFYIEERSTNLPKRCYLLTFSYYLRFIN